MTKASMKKTGKKKGAAKKKSQPIEITELKYATSASWLIQKMIMLLRQMPEPWSKIKEARQGQIIDEVREVVRTALREIVTKIAGNKYPAVIGEVTGVNFAANGSVKFTIDSTSPRLHDLVDHVGKRAVLVLVDPEKMEEGIFDIKPDPDQRNLLT